MKNKEMTPEYKEDQRSTSTAFILMFPSVILTALAVFYAPTIIGLLAIALAIYQFLMSKKFIQDYYKIR
jgi:hypothetical protein